MTKGTKYQFKLVGYKKTLFDNIKWSIGMGDTEIDPWWNTTFVKRNNITVSGMGAAARINYPVAVNITYDSDMDSNFDDLRFLNDTTSLNYWIESNVTSAWVYVWIKIPYLPSNPNVTISMYYGSGDTQTTSDGVSTFLLFDDFNDNSINTSLWTTPQEFPSESNGIVTYTNLDLLDSIQTFGINVSIKTRVNISSPLPYDINGFANDSTGLQALIQPASSITRTNDGVGAENKAMISLPINYWDTYETYRNSTTQVDFYANKTWLNTHIVRVPTGAMHTRVGCSGNQQMQMDWIFVRNYTFPDARASITSEETYTAPPVSMSLSVQMPQYIGYSTEDTTTDSNYSSSVWNNNWTMISGGFKTVPVLANTSKSTWTGTIKSYRPVSYVEGGGINTNLTYAYDKGINDTTTYAQSGGDGAAVGVITYNFNISQNLSTTLFYSFNGTSGGVQLYNFSSANWDTVGTSGATLNMAFTYLQPVYINSTGNVLLRITSAGVSTGAYTRLWDTYIIYQTIGLTNPPRYDWNKFNITNFPYFDTATLNLYKQPILDNSWGENCNITKPCVVNSYYSLNQTWKGINWNNQPSWINYIMERKNITSNIGNEQFNITSNLKSVYSNSTFMLRIPMQDIWLKSINLTKSGFPSNLTVYYRPYIYSYEYSAGNVTNSTSAFDYNYNDTSTYMEVRSAGSTIQYWFEVGTNKFNGTLFFTYDYDYFSGTNPIIQVLNSTNDWYSFYASYYDAVGNCYNFGSLHTCPIYLLEYPKYADSTGRIIDSLGLVKMRIVGTGSMNSIKLYDTYIVINDVSSGPYINASVTKYLMNESSCVSLGSVPCYQNGSFTPKGQTNSQWIWNITNVGTINGSVSAYWSQTLPSCMSHYLSINYTLEPSVDYNASSTASVNITSLNTSQSQQFWGFFILNNCTAGYWINSTLVFG
jgi:hypothetical protein